MLEEKIGLVCSVDIEPDVQERIRRVGVKGLNIEKAKELGVFNRISNLLCAMHVSIMAAYRIYGKAVAVIDLFGGRKNEISREMGLYEKAYDRFVGFWTGYYAHEKAGIEVGGETEALYHQIMYWAQLPEAWDLGDEQRLKDDVDVTIKVVRPNNSDLLFRRSVVEVESLGDTQESWCVTKFDEKALTQETVNTNMDKASALMVAKRLSNEDPDCIYTACMVQEIRERRVEVVPFKAFKENKTTGTIKNVLK